MRLLLSILPGLLWASSAAAAVDVSGELSAVSDYRYRGLSLSRGHPAIQGSVTVEHDSGLYGQLWGSTLGSGDPTDSEVDFTAGFSKDLSEALSIDLSETFFAYPSAGSDNYFETTAIATAARGNASASFGFSYVPRQRATGHGDNAYLFGSLEVAVPRTPLTLKAGLGYERGAFDEAAHGGKWDWTLGCNAEFKPVRLGLAYVGSDADGGDRDALVASAFVSW